MASKEEVRGLASELGIDLVGFAPAEPLTEARDRIRTALRDGLVPEDADWGKDALLGSCEPRRFLPTARTVIVAAQCYLTNEPEDLSKPGEPHGLIARYTWRNHYRDLRQRLKELAQGLGNAKFRYFSNGPLAEKPLAVRAGLGAYGKLGIILTGRFGTRIVLGELLTELDFEPDQELPEDCGDCTACMDACPTRAITAPRRVDLSKCLQHLTNSASPLPPEIRACWGKRLYGCTICQDACPRNLHVEPVRREVDSGFVGPSLPLIPLLAMTEKEYREKYAGNQLTASWVRFEAIRRNACLALGHSGDRAAIEPLISIMRSDPSPMVRGHAAWALGRLGVR